MALPVVYSSSIMATKEQIQEVKARINIVDVVSRYVRLRPAGKSFSGLCPFHNEKTPSFFVNPQLGIFKCFGCGEAGDVITFLQKIERISFFEALQKLAKEAGVELTGSFDDKQAKNINKARELLKKVALLYNKLLVKHEVGRQALEYAQKRGLAHNIIRTFLVGYAPKEKHLVQNFAQKLGYTQDVVRLVGLVNDKGWDKFYDRLIFPIFDASGNVVGFSGRVIAKDDYRAKYLNSPESPVFKKRFILYGLYQAKQDILREKLAVIVEGQMDVIASFKAGVKIAVAPLGTGLTTTQLTLLRRYTENVAFAFDNDEAGQKSLYRAVPLALEAGLNVYVIKYPKEFKDVDELVSQNPSLWQNAVVNKQEFFKSQLIRLKDILEYGSYSEFESKLAQVLDILKHASPIKVESVLKMYADALDIPADTLREALENQNKAFVGSLEKENSEKSEDSITPYDYFLGMLLAFPVLATLLLDKIEDFEECFEAAYYKVLSSIRDFVSEIAQLIKSRFGPDISLEKLNEIFSSKFDQEFKLNVLEPLKLDPATMTVILHLGFVFKGKSTTLTPDIIVEFKDVYKRVRILCLSDKVGKLQEKIAVAELKGDEAEATRLAKELQVYLERLKQIS